MVNRDQDGNVKKSWSEKFKDLLAKVPGLSAYQGREQMRDQDKVLRTHSADKITGIKSALDEIKKDLLSQGKFSLLDDLEGLTKKLDRARDTHRFDAYGLGSFLEGRQVLEDELSAYYDYDLKILEQIEAFEQTLSSLASGLTEEDVKGALPMLRQETNALLDLILARKNLVSAPQR